MRTQGVRQSAAARGNRLALPVLALAAACSGGSARDPGGADVRYDSVYASEQSGVDAPLREVVRSAEEWSALWDRIMAGYSPVPPRPDIDFRRDMLIIVGLGTRPSGGYAVQIAGIALAGGALTVAVREVAPGAGCIATMALTAPITVVRLERLDAEIEFVETREERVCD